MKTTFTSWFRKGAITFLFIGFSGAIIQAQMRVGQPAGSPDPSAALDISGGPYSNGSPFRGMAPPKVALSQTSSTSPVTNPVTGLLVYNTAKAGDLTPGYYYWEGSKWVRFLTSTASGAARVAANPGNGQFIPAYTITQVQSLTASTTDAPTHILVVDQGREGLFRYDANDSSPDDNALTLVATPHGLHYKRVVTDHRITPQMFGATGDGITDDKVALQAWLNVTGNWEHYLPAGTYKSSSSLIRTNQGGITLRGAGQSRSQVIFSADVDGIKISNPAGGNLGLIQVEDLAIVAGAGMSSGRIGLYIASQHEQQPGVIIRNISFVSPSGNEYPTGLNLHDCSSVTVDGLGYQGAIIANRSIFAATALLIDNTYFNPPSQGTTGRPAVNYEIRNLQILAVRCGVRIDAKGSPGIEGVAIHHARIVSGERGIWATSTGYLAPLITLDDIHHEGYGLGIDIDGFTQVQTSDCLLYTQAPPAGASQAVSAVRFNNPINIRGNLEIVAFSPVVCGVDLTGTGNTAALDVLFTNNYGSSHGIRNGAGIANADLHVNRLFNGANGPDTGLRVLDLSPGNARVTGKPDDLPENALVTPDNNGVLDLTNQVSNYVTIPATYTGNLTNVLAYNYRTYTIYNQGKLPVLNSSNIQLANNENLTLTPNSKLTLKYLGNHSEEISRVTKRSGTVVSGSTTADVTVTVDVSLYKQVTVFQTGSFTLTILLDKSNCNVNDDILIKRYNEAQNGLVVIKNIDYTSGGFIQDENSAYNAFYTLPTTNGNRQRRFSLSGQGYWDYTN